MLINTKAPNPKQQAVAGRTQKVLGILEGKYTHNKDNFTVRNVKREKDKGKIPRTR